MKYITCFILWMLFTLCIFLIQCFYHNERLFTILLLVSMGWWTLFSPAFKSLFKDS
jgi:predicted membrane channel-forming protein YqfA (hemolysin III family)